MGGGVIDTVRSFEFWAFTPDPSAQNPKQKIKFSYTKNKN